MTDEPVKSDSHPKCEKTPCGSYAGKPRMRRDWLLILDRYNLCSQFKALPRAGGIVDQDWFEMRLLSEIRTAETEVRSENRKQAARKGGPMGVLMSLPVMGQ